MLRRTFVGSAGAAVAAIAAMVLAGWFYRVDALTNWGGAIPMAVPTAVCFLVVGAALMALASEPLHV